jgi:hypothetical protein
MSDVQLGIPERSALLALMTFSKEEISNGEIRERYGFTIDKKVRDRLVADGYLKAEQKPRIGFVHDLKDAGWARCRKELAAPLPAKAGKGYRVLFGVLRSLDQYLTATGLTLADFFAPEAKPDGEVAAVSAGRTADDKVKAAYDGLASQPGAWVGLVRLRNALPDVSRQEFDDALLRLDLHEHVFLIPEVNQKALTDADRAAAIHVGGEDKHLLSIRSA